MSDYKMKYEGYHAYRITVDLEAANAKRRVGGIGCTEMVVVSHNLASLRKAYESDLWKLSTPLELHERQWSVVRFRDPSVTVVRGKPILPDHVRTYEKMRRNKIPRYPNVDATRFPQDAFILAFKPILFE